MKNNKTTIEDLTPEGKELYKIVSYPEVTILEWCNKKEFSTEQVAKNHLSSNLKSYTGKFKEGDKVKVIRKAESREGDWKNCWVSDFMDKFIGKTITIANSPSDFNDYRFIDCPFGLPEFILEKVEPVFYTEEGNPIYPGESCWLVSNGWMGNCHIQYAVWERNAEYDKRHQIKYFSNKENADKYYIEVVTKGFIIDKWYKHQYYNIYILFQGDVNCVGFDKGVYKTTIAIRNGNNWMLANLNVVNKLLINKLNEK